METTNTNQGPGPRPELPTPCGGIRTLGRLTRNPAQREAPSSLPQAKLPAHLKGTQTDGHTGVSGSLLISPGRSPREALTGTPTGPEGRAGPTPFPQCSAAEHAQRGPARGPYSPGWRATMG